MAANDEVGVPVRVKRGWVQSVPLLYFSAVPDHPPAAQTDAVLWAVAGVGFLVIVVVLLVITVFDSNAVPWPLRFAPLPGLAIVVPAAVLEAPVPLTVGLALVLVGVGSQILWDQMLGGARKDGRGRHSIRRRWR